MSVTYKMRLDCGGDLDNILAFYKDHPARFSNVVTVLDEEFPDVEVEFQSTLTKSRLIADMKELDVDLHVGYETLQPILLYTGIRDTEDY